MREPLTQTTDYGQELKYLFTDNCVLTESHSILVFFVKYLLYLLSADMISFDADAVANLPWLAFMF